MQEVCLSFIGMLSTRVGVMLMSDYYSVFGMEMGTLTEKKGSSIFLEIMLST